jgi:large subunit ribosomal protein L29
MKTKEIRALSSGEMELKLTELKHELFNLRFQHEIGQLENPSKMKQTKRDIARIRTVLNEMALSANESDN